MSDQKYIRVTFDINFNKSGPGYWTLNTSLLKENMFIDGMKQLIRNFDASIYAHKDVVTLKSKINEYSIN